MLKLKNLDDFEKLDKLMRIIGELKPHFHRGVSCEDNAIYSIEIKDLDTLLIEYIHTYWVSSCEIELILEKNEINIHGKGREEAIDKITQVISCAVGDLYGI